jgi:hypothetical protein
MSLITGESRVIVVLLLDVTTERDVAVICDFATSPLW